MSNWRCFVRRTGVANERMLRFRRFPVSRGSFSCPTSRRNTYRDKMRPRAPDFATSSCDSSYSLSHGLNGSATMGFFYYVVVTRLFLRVRLRVPRLSRPTLRTGLGLASTVCTDFVRDYNRLFMLSQYSDLIKCSGRED